MRAYQIPGIILLTLLILITGCISPEIQDGNPQEYELPGLINTTIYYLNTSSTEVVQSVINSTTLRIDMGDTEGMNINNPVAVDYSGENVSFNVSKEVVFGKSYARYEFKSPFTGFVAFTQQDGQDFSRALTNNGSVRVVLPRDFTTGSRFLGIAQPKPDNITVDTSGREVLIWENPYPDHRVISVKYYEKNAPVILGYFFAFLFITGVSLFGYYYMVIHKLNKKRVMMERDIRKK